MEKKQNLKELNKLASQIRDKEAAIDQELKLGLITKQEALNEQLTLNNLRSHLIDEKTEAHELKQRSIDFANAADTLDGAATNLLAIQNVVKKNELDIQIAALKIDSYALKVTIKHLEKGIKKRQQALAKMQRSPYILATKKPSQP